MIYSSLQKQGGFSLVEMLVAISILLIVIIGPMTITSKAAKSASFASEQVQAFFLAQEGLELAQMLRDNLLLENINDSLSRPSPWTDFTNPSGSFSKCYSSSGCSLVWADSSTVAIGSCSDIRDCRLYYKDSGRSKFSHENSGVQTPFARRVNFSLLADKSAVAVRSVVSWRTGSLLSEQNVLVETYLYNIYDKP